MPTSYTGNGTQPTTTAYARIAIASSTNANPIVVTTSGNHGFASGDTVQIEGHTVNTTANTTQVITKLSNTTFSIPVAGVGVGGATGVAIDYSVLPSLTIPSDGDAAPAASVNVAFQALADKMPFLYQRVGAYRLLNVYEAATSDDAYGAWSTNSTAVAPYNGAGPAWKELASGQLIANPTPPIITEIGDLFEIYFSSTILSQNVAAVGQIGLGTSLNGATPFVVCPGSGVRINFSATDTPRPINLQGYFFNAASNNATIAFSLVGYSSVALANAVVLSGHRQMTVRHMRPN